MDINVSRRSRGGRLAPESIRQREDTLDVNELLKPQIAHWCRAALFLLTLIVAIENFDRIGTHNRRAITVSKAISAKTQTQ
jgi:hypothetical protein